MPTLVLTELWVHWADDHTDFITFDGGTEDVSRSKPGETRTMANGRVRSVTQAGSTRALDVTAPYIPQDVYDTLDGWVAEGALLMLRDAKRRVCWGHVFDLSGPASGAEEETVTFTFRVVSHDESV